MSEKESKNSSYLSFKLGKEIFAANVDSTIKILQLSEITKVPNAPSNMKGVINHHGNVLPVVDLNQTLGLPETEYSKNTCIIILSIKNTIDQLVVGAIVDEVLNVEEVNIDQISEPPSLRKNSNKSYISGVFKKDETFIMILNIDNIFSEFNLENQIN